MTALMERLSRWLVSTLIGIKAIQDLDTQPKCPVCGVPIKDGYHDFGVFVEQP